MSAPVSSPPTTEPTRTSSVPVLRTPDEARAAARALAERIAVGAIERDLERRHPIEQLHDLASTGLLGITVHGAHGGGGLPRSVAGDVLRLIARGDSAVAQLVLSHFVLLELLGDAAPAEQRDPLYADVVAGGWLGNATAERGTAHVFDRRTTAVPQDDGSYRLSGRKYYTTGALGSTWIGVAAILDGDAEHPVAVFVRPTDEGVSIDTDWSAFGQRSTASGSIVFDEVVVPAERVVDPGLIPADPPPSAFGAYDQLLHVAIDTGIARAALEDGARFVAERSRPWVESGVERVSDEPHVQLRFGQLQTRLHALEALVERGGLAIDAAHDSGELTDENTAAASLAVAESKAYAQEVAIQIATDVIELAGTSATDEAHGLDRHWRNVRTHSLHDPARWKYVHIGNHLLNGVNPPRHPLI